MYDRQIAQNKLQSSSNHKLFCGLIYRSPMLQRRINADDNNKCASPTIGLEGS